MSDLVLSFDLGTGSCKASLWSPDGDCVGSAVAEYATSYPAPGHQVQRPEDWWQAIRSATAMLFASTSRQPHEVSGLAVSGHSLGVVAVDRRGRLLRDETPIWSDSRGRAPAAEFFERFDERSWYETTGCGFPSGLYPIFKIEWFRRHDPQLLTEAHNFLGSKDWINLRLTGQIATDHSYASGSGAYSLTTQTYSGEILAATGIDGALLPPILNATDTVGELGVEPARELRLRPGIPVSCGGVDNSCMSAGSLNTSSGRVYLSLGSSSWVTSTGVAPVLDFDSKPYTFRSLIPGLYDSALSSFSSGTSLRWMRRLLGSEGERLSDEDFVQLATGAEPGADGLMFLPMLAGGAPIEGGSDIRGSLVGLDARHGRGEIARASFEGAALAIAHSFRKLARLIGSENEVVIAGGGSRSAWVRQLYADILGCTVVSTGVDQQAAALGAAATSFVGTGAWSGFEETARAHTITARHEPDPALHERYDALMDTFEATLASHIDLHLQLTEPSYQRNTT